MQRGKILVLEDEGGIRRLLELYLQKTGFDVMALPDGSQLLPIFQTFKPDLVILDMVLPGRSGLECCELIRRISNVPILFISCKRESRDIISALQIGGDDYMTKPFQFDELVARVHAHMRRNTARPVTAPEPEILRMDGLEINLTSYTVTLDGKDIPLAAKEYELLVTLAKNPNRVYRTEDLYRLIWNPLECGDPRTVMVHIYNLRKKIERKPEKPTFILTVRGVGYKCNGQLQEVRPLKRESFVP